jgi:CDP-diacylglycerol---glycerol-3-phosphate 3-phosphatidyltransferase
MNDVYFAYLLCGVFAVGGLAYAVRLVGKAPARSDRVERVGGSVLLGKGVMNWTYWAAEPLVRALISLGVTANALTWSSLLIGVAAGGALATGWFGLACLLATCATIGDILDGQVARITGTGSRCGELLDSVVDRYTDFALVGGLAIYFRASIPALVLALTALLAGTMVSYVSAKAEALRVTTPRGLMRRHERATYLIVGVAMTSVFGSRIAIAWPGWPRETPVLVALLAVAVVGNLAAITRLVRIARALR